MHMAAQTGHGSPTPSVMRRIMIIGGSGAGKSTLARNLGARLNLPVYHMDREVHWLPGWVERPAKDKAAIVTAIAARDEWVFEGGHSSTYRQRLARADLLIWVDAPFWRRLWRVTWRALTGLGQSRPDLADNCPETLKNLPEFWRFLWSTRKSAPEKLARIYAEADLPKHHLRSFAEIDAFLERFPT